MRQQLRKNSGLTREEKKEAKIKADKRRLRNVIKQNERLKKKVSIGNCIILFFIIIIIVVQGSWRP